MRKANSFVAVMFLFIICTAAHAEEVDIKSLPGYVDLEEIEIPAGAGKVTEVTLGPALIRMAEKSSDNGDEELTETLSKILSIQVKSFQIDAEDTDRIRVIMEKIEAKLKKDNWERLITAKDEDEFTIVSIKHDKDEVVGLLVMSLESDGEVTFVNIAGNLDLDQLEDLGHTIDLKPRVGRKGSEKEE